MSECRCDFRGKILGDGCDVCNPAKALKYTLETAARTGASDMTTPSEDNQGSQPLGLPLNDQLGVGACEMAAMRMQARALAFQWFAARNFQYGEEGFAYFMLRAADFGLRDDCLKGVRIKVSLAFERDA